MKQFICMLAVLTVCHGWSQESYPFNPDGNGDGQITLPDLLDMLSLYGTTFDIEGHLCGMPVEYNGYSYATTKVGNQCWFAENLRTELFRNGEEVPLYTANADWESEGFNQQPARSYPTNMNGLANVEVYGMLYNWFAVTDSRGLCPSGWHAPSLSEMSALRSRCGAEECSAYVLRSDDWGFNSVGFNAIQGFYRQSSGSYSGGTNFWTRTYTPPGTIDAGYRYLYVPPEQAVPQAFLENNAGSMGLSVRCLKN
jgi:uncharacterized protein (TIGR02145 family)